MNKNYRVMNCHIIKARILVFSVLLLNNQVSFSASPASEAVGLGVKLGAAILGGNVLSKVLHSNSSKVSLDDFFSEKYGDAKVDETITCEGVDVQFAKGVDWTPAGFIPILKLGEKSIRLSAGCYSTMSCVTYKQKPSVMVVSAPACGGNAIAEEYLVYDLKSTKRKILNYNQAKKHVVPFE